MFETNRKKLDVKYEVEQLIAERYEHCGVCGALVLKGSLLRVWVSGTQYGYSTGMLGLMQQQQAQAYPYTQETKYCKRCKPPYDEVRDGKYYKTIPSSSIEVDKFGNEVKPSAKKTN